jgi:Transglycosylase SLT domain
VRPAYRTLVLSIALSLGAPAAVYGGAVGEPTAPAVREPSTIFGDAAAEYATRYGVPIEVAAYMVAVDLGRYHHPNGDVDRWYWTSIQAGFTNDEWPTVARVMDCESKGRPDAIGSLYRGKRAVGLMQIYGWTGTMIRLGIWSTAADAFDPLLNMRAARWVLDNSSWRAWQCY